MHENFFPYVALSHVRFLELGAYECLFNKQSSFLYKTLTDCEGYFIRKKTWHKIYQDHEEVGDALKEQIKR